MYSPNVAIKFLRFRHLPVTISRGANRSEIPFVAGIALIIMIKNKLGESQYSYAVSDKRYSIMVTYQTRHIGTAISMGDGTAQFMQHVHVPQRCLSLPSLSLAWISKITHPSVHYAQKNHPSHKV